MTHEESIPLTMRMVAKIVQENGIERSPEDPRDYLDIALGNRLVELMVVAVEPVGYFDLSDVHRMKYGGCIVRAVAYGQEVSHVVPVGYTRNNE